MSTSSCSAHSHRIIRSLRCTFTPHTDEAFYVAEGDATFQLGDREVPAGPGCLVFVPRGTPHTVWNSGDRQVRGLIVVSPGDAEHLMVPVDGSGAA